MLVIIAKTEALSPSVNGLEVLANIPYKSFWIAKPKPFHLKNAVCL